MVRFLKYAALGLGLVLVLGGIVVWQVWAHAINGAVTGAVETYGPPLTGTPVKLERVSISPFSGKGSISGLLLGNPEGFKTDRSFRLDDVAVSLDLATLFSETIVIREFTINGAEVTYEMSLRGSNIARIMKSIEAVAEATEKAEEAQADGPKIIIDRFRLTNTTVRASATAVQGKTATLALPDIELQDIGRKSTGVTAAEAVRQVMQPVTTAIAKVAATMILEDQGLPGMDNAPEAVKDGVSKLKGLLGK